MVAVGFVVAGARGAGVCRRRRADEPIGSFPVGFPYWFPGQDAPNLVRESIGIEWFADEAVEASGARTFYFLRCDVCGDGDDGDVLEQGCFACAFEDAISVFTRYLDVEEEEVGVEVGLLTQQFEYLPTGCSSGTMLDMAVCLQQVKDDHEVIGVVFDYQHSGILQGDPIHRAIPFDGESERLSIVSYGIIA